MLSWASSLISSKPAEPPRISGLWIYPIKSCGRGIPLDAATYSQTGFQYDRQWMLVDSSSLSMQTARQLPSMIAIQPSINRAAQTLDVTIPAHGSHAAQTYSIPLTPPSDAELLTGLKVWRTITDAYIVTPPSHPLQLALSSFLNRDVLLVQKGPEFRQAGLPGYIDKIGFPTEYEEDGGPNTAFADGFPFLIATEPSMTDLRKRTVAAEDEKTIAGRRATGDAPLDLLRFRANIIVDGGIEPWEEDGWKEISAGEEGHRLHIAGRCGRCTVPEVDVETGQRQPFYPSAVLGTFRVVDGFAKGKACLGVNTIPRRATGTLRVGDKIVIIDRYPRDRDGGYTRIEETFNEPSMGYA